MNQASAFTGSSSANFVLQFPDSPNRIKPYTQRILHFLSDQTNWIMFVYWKWKIEKMVRKFIRK